MLTSLASGGQGATMHEESRLTSDAAEALWRRWKTDGDTSARDRLVLSYAPMVKYLAMRKIRGAPNHVSLDDLVAAGLLRLVQSVERFDPALGATFEQYAWTRVAGGMIDELRKADWAPRSVRRRQREIEEARGQLALRLGRAPTVTEVADRLGVERSEVEGLLSELEQAEVTSLNAVVRESEESSVEVVDTIRGEGHSPEDAALAQERAVVIRQALTSLNERERLIVQMVFVEGRSARDVAGIIGVSESRVSQVTREIRGKLAGYLDRYDAQAA
jgi:RNA polymerase sigma factor for flagellar operon FliA